MSFSKTADTYFTCNLLAFENATVDTLGGRRFRCPKFITSVDPRSEWNLVLSVRDYQVESVTCSYPHTQPLHFQHQYYGDLNYDIKIPVFKKIIDIELICNEKVPTPKDFKVNITIGTGIEAVTRSYIIFGNVERINFPNFIDCETILKENMQIIVVEMFLKTKNNQSFTDFTNLEFLSDFQISVKEKKFYAHKVNDLFCLEILQIFHCSCNTIYFIFRLS